jgi:hypothetical protein
MAKAQVEITAVDRTKAAIDSASRGLRKLESVTQKVGSRLNLAFSVITGAIFVQGFNKLAQSVAKTEEGSRGFAQALDSVKKSTEGLLAPTAGIGGATQSLQELNRVLNDPGVVSGVNAIVNAMLVGFAKAATSVASVVKLIREGLLSLGVGTAQSAEEIAIGLRRQITSEESRAGPLGPIPGSNIQKRVDALKEQLKLLESVVEEEKKLTEQKILDAEKLAELEKSLVGIKTSSTKAGVSAFETLYDKWDNATKTTIQKQAESFREFSAILDELVSSGRISIEEANARLSEELDGILTGVKVTGKKTFEEVKTDVGMMSEFAAQAARNMQTAFADFLFDPFSNGLKGMLKGFVDTIRRMVAEFAASQLMKFFFTPFASGSGLLASFAKFAIGGKAMGGSVLGSKPYIVGERGPELFVPGSNGSIVPNDRMGGMTVAPVYNIDARGATADLQKALPGILQENNRRIFDELDRRYGIGR